MSLQMQIHRGLIALAIALALGGLALGSASADDALGARDVGAVIRAVQKDNPVCDSSLRIEVARSVHLTVPCDLSCTPMNSLLNSLHVSTTMRPSRCVATHTA
jgi:hypothetical protein